MPTKNSRFEEGFSIFYLTGFDEPYDFHISATENHSLWLIKRKNMNQYKNRYILKLMKGTSNEVISFTDFDEIYYLKFNYFFFEKYMSSYVYNDISFLINENSLKLSISEKLYVTIENICREIYYNISIENRANKFKIVGHLVSVLFYHLRDYIFDQRDIDIKNSRESEILLSFKKNLENHYKDLREGKAPYLFKVKDYGKEQNYHPNYLSKIIKKETGKPISSWIAEKTISEAKKLLNTDEQIQNIAYMLGFHEVSHFSKFFKSHTSISPSAYRENINQ
ncbi:helix-turn-helix domain-containing protein [Chryseobacterium sp. Chry.R1]|uniref:helix-turn-helix domain-containing protein n=1 Tax=Chryseobacterium sp. Chry.R1 TaxID=3139392 RepID=UPI0031F85A5E